MLVLVVFFIELRWIHELSPLIRLFMVVAILLFFSSIRRHTRYWRDWSSDVCSSDLHRDRPHDQTIEEPLRFRPHGHTARKQAGGTLLRGRVCRWPPIGPGLPLRARTPRGDRKSVV